MLLLSIIANKRMGASWFS